MILIEDHLSMIDCYLVDWNTHCTRQVGEIIDFINE